MAIAQEIGSLTTDGCPLIVYYAMQRRRRESLSETTLADYSKPRSVRRFGLTEGAIFRLWKAALKDDGALLDQVIEKAFHDMSSFNRRRAEDVISSVVNRDTNARAMLGVLFADMRKLSEANVSFSGAGCQTARFWL